MIASIFAVDANGGIGKDGTLPWPKDSEDLKWFKDCTLGHVVVMGRKTWEDPFMPHPLPNRINVIVSSTEDFKYRDKASLIVNPANLDKDITALKDAFPMRTVWIIGGAQLLQTTAHLIDCVYLTKFDDTYNCDVIINIDSYLSKFSLLKEKAGQEKRFQIYHAKLP